MPAYVVVDVSIRDAAAYEEYKKLTPASLEAFGGKFIVRGGKTESIEGGWQPGRVVVAEFPDMATLKRWYDSEIYTEAKRIRHASADTRMIFVEGV